MWLSTSDLAGPPSGLRIAMTVSPDLDAACAGHTKPSVMMPATLDANRPPRGAAAHRSCISFAYGSMMGPSYAPLRSFSSVERAEARFA